MSSVGTEQGKHPVTTGSENVFAIKFSDKSVFSVNHPVQIDMSNYCTRPNTVAGNTFAVYALLGDQTDMKYIDSVRTAKSMGDIETLIANNSKITNTDKNKSTRMALALTLRFKKNPKLLTDTGDKLIVVETFDEFWGMGVSGHGKNMYGKLLEKLRTGFNNKVKPPIQKSSVQAKTAIPTVQVEVAIPEPVQVAKPAPKAPVQKPIHEPTKPSNLKPKKSNNEKTKQKRKVLFVEPSEQTAVKRPADSDVQQEKRQRSKIDFKVMN